MKDDNAYNFRVIDYGDSVQVRLYSTPVTRGGQVSKLDRFFPHLVEIDVLKLYNTFKIYLPRGIFIWTNLLSYLTQPMN